MIDAPQPIPTLFPYTTLFRSRLHGADARPQLAAPQGLRESAAAGPSIQRARLSRRRDPGRQRQDRKSTRLNSSHVESSYAVFCLTKTRRSRQASVARRKVEVI